MLEALDTEAEEGCLPVERSWSEPVRYAITDFGTAAAGAEGTRRAAWLASLERWAAARVDVVQLRARELGAGELFRLAAEGVALLQRLAAAGSPRPLLVVNGRPDVAAAAAADGAHLTARTGELSPGEARAIFAAAGRPPCLVSVSCHEAGQAAAAAAGGADLLLFGPVFGKVVEGREVVAPSGLPALRAACAAAGRVPVLALGGVTPERIADCRRAGARGVAGIRLFGQGAAEPA